MVILKERLFKMSDSFKFPTLSGDFDSLEVTESQAKLLDLLKAFGKMSLIASESSAKFKTEKVGGLESFLYQINKLQEENPKKITRELVEKLEQDVRYTENEQKIGNKTEFLRVLLGNAHTNKVFVDLVNKVIEEQMELGKKRSDNRYFAEQSQAKDLGL